MKTIITLCVLVAAVAAFITFSDANVEDENWMTDFAKAKEIASKNGRPILVDFSGSDWCGWCIKLEREVFSKKEFKAYAKDNLVLFLADFPRRKQLPAALKKQNEALAQKYRVKGFPTVLLLDAKGKVLATTGYKAGGADAYVRHLKQLLKKK